jgi:hypothetical protein
MLQSCIVLLKIYLLLTRGLYYKKIYGRSLLIFVLSWHVCPWQASPAESIVFGLETSLERLARDKHSNLLRKSIDYGRNTFYSTVFSKYRV